MAPPFLTSALCGGEWPTSHPSHPGTHQTEAWIDVRAGRHCGVDTNLLSLPGIELSAFSPQPLIILTELFWLSLGITGTNKNFSMGVKIGL
jgi:hypothetical protein